MKHEVYLRSYELAKKQITNRTILLKVVFNGVKAVNTLEFQKPYTLQEAEQGKKLTCEVMKFMERVTPRELMQVFPIHKEYNGEKYGSKDYFYTREYLNQIDIDKPIGDKLKEFLWNYCNWELWEFEIDHGIYRREYELIKEEEKAKSISEQIGNITKKVEELQERQRFLVEIFKEVSNDLNNTYEKYKPYKDYTSVRNRISITAYKAKREFIKTYTVYLVIEEMVKVIQEEITQERKKILEVDGLQEAIERMAETSREEANNWIRMLNVIRAE
ncbi:MAG: hypothetical protein KID02_04945 [Clostridiales bacterium]|nr:hypothetical protein [Clostridiales bacterium]